MADRCVGASESKVPVGKLGVEERNQQPQIELAAVRGAIIDLVVAEIPGGNACGNDAAKVILRAAFLDADAGILVMKCFGVRATIREKLFANDVKVFSLRRRAACI